MAKGESKFDRDVRKGRKTPLEWGNTGPRATTIDENPVQGEADTASPPAEPVTDGEENQPGPAPENAAEKPKTKLEVYIDAREALIDALQKRIGLAFSRTKNKTAFKKAISELTVTDGLQKMLNGETLSIGERTGSDIHFDGIKPLAATWKTTLSDCVSDENARALVKGKRMTAAESENAEMQYVLARTKESVAVHERETYIVSFNEVLTSIKTEIRAEYDRRAQKNKASAENFKVAITSLTPTELATLLKSTGRGAMQIAGEVFHFSEALRKAYRSSVAIRKDYFVDSRTRISKSKYISTVNEKEVVANDNAQLLSAVHTAFVVSESEASLMQSEIGPLKEAYETALVEFIQFWQEAIRASIQNPSKLIKALEGEYKHGIKNLSNEVVVKLYGHRWIKVGDVPLIFDKKMRAELVRALQSARDAYRIRASKPGERAAFAQTLASSEVDHIRDALQKSFDEPATDAVAPATTEPAIPDAEISESTPNQNAEASIQEKFNEAGTKLVDTVRSSFQKTYKGYAGITNGRTLRNNLKSLTQGMTDKKLRKILLSGEYFVKQGINYDNRPESAIAMQKAWNEFVIVRDEYYKAAVGPGPLSKENKAALIAQAEQDFIQLVNVVRTSLDEEAYIGTYSGKAKAIKETRLFEAEEAWKKWLKGAGLGLVAGVALAAAIVGGIAGTVALTPMLIAAAAGMGIKGIVYAVESITRFKANKLEKEGTISALAESARIKKSRKQKAFWIGLGLGMIAADISNFITTGGGFIIKSLGLGSLIDSIAGTHHAAAITTPDAPSPTSAPDQAPRPSSGIDNAPTPGATGTQGPSAPSVPSPDTGTPATQPTPNAPQGTPSGVEGAPAPVPAGTEMVVKGVADSNDGVTQVLEKIRQQYGVEALRKLGGAAAQLADADTPQELAKFAADYGLFDPTNVNDSVIVQAGDTFGFAKDGSFVFDAAGSSTPVAPVTPGLGGREMVDTGKYPLLMKFLESLGLAKK